MKLPATTPEEIYQHYWRGPAAVLRLFEQVFGTLALYEPPPPDIQQSAIEALGQEIDRLKAQITRLQEQISRLHHHNFQLQRRNAELEALFLKDSHNSSRPPSTDPPWGKRTRSLRRPSGKRPGGQPGHPGQTKPLAAHPSRLVLHPPPECRHCQAPLAAGDTVGCERRQVIDLLPVKLRVTEHRAEIRRCPACGRRTKGLFPAEVRAALQYGPAVKARALYLLHYQLLPYQRTSEAMRDLFGCAISPGTIANTVGAGAAGLVETELKIKRKLRRSRLIHLDETGLRVAGRGQYVHVTSNERLTHYASDPHRGRAAVDAIGILPGYRGNCVHDGWPTYALYTQCGHGLCGAHLLRELTFFAEANAEQQAWAGPLKGLLLEIKGEVERAREDGARHLASDQESSFLMRYEQLLKQGIELNAGTEARAGEGAAADRGESAGDGVRQQALKLLRRMERRREEVLRFMTDFGVPFDNNQAERDLRMVKLKQKISGCFRAEQGARRFCRLRTYLSTMRKQGKAILKALEEACRGRPLNPTS